MKVIWRQYEILFFSIITGIKIAGCMFGFGGITREQGQNAFAAHYGATHSAFSLLRNVILPQAGSFLLLYLCYILVNIVVISFFKKTAANKNAAAIFKNTVLAAFALLIVAFMLALGVNAFTWLGHPWYYNYGGFGLLSFFGYNDQPLVRVFAGLGSALVFVFVYALYACIRESVTHYLENRNNSKSYQVLVINRIIAFFVIYLSVPVLVLTFNMAGGFFESPFFAIYFGFLLPASLVCIVNMYSLFPSYDNRRLLSTGFVTRLLFYTFLCTFPIVFFFVFINKMGVFLSSWAIQFFITTPISWLAWRQQKDKIMQLRGLQKDLEKSKANLQFLRSQINPHFLFNTLNTLYGMALQEGSEQTTKGIQKLGDMMRFMLHENNLDFIPMGREIEYLQNYISLQTLRTQASPNIVIEDNLHTQGCNHTIAPMLLVPLVENAFKHGISLVEKSWIKITLECGESQIRFTVVNSLHTKKASDPEQYSNGIGLKNVEERLKFLYQGRHQLHISKTEGEFFVQIIIQP